MKNENSSSSETSAERADRRKFANIAGILVTLALLAGFIAIGPIGKKSGPAVRVYTSVDEVFARQILDQFTRDTGIPCQAVYDTEAGKTTGLVRRIAAEKTQPRCDVWWSGEVFGTIELARADLLAEYDPPAAADIPAAWRDAHHRWTGCAARARVLAYAPDRVKAESLPASWQSLAQLPGDGLKRLAIANPQFGTTRGHVAAIFAFGTPESGADWLRSLRDAGTTIADGNSHAVRLIESGRADLCLTDTDDVLVARQRGSKIEMLILPLRGAADESPVGPVWIPCTAALVANGPNPEGGRKLVDYLVNAATERALALSDSRNLPVRDALREQVANEVRAIDAALGTLFSCPPTPIDFERVAGSLELAGDKARELLLR